MSRPRAGKLFPLLLCALAPAAAAQSTLFGFDGAQDGAQCGQGLAAVGDVDGDGVPDLAVGSPGDDGAGVDAGLVRVLSGATGAVLLSVPGLKPGDEFGRSVAGVGDLDLDGVPDVLAGSPKALVGGVRRGRAVVLSGADGHALHVLNGTTLNELFGFSVAGVGDADLDGRPDFAVGAPQADFAGVDSGRVRVYSGLTGAVLRTFDGDSPGDLMGYSVAAAGDVDLDGVTDLIAGAPQDDDNGSGAGSARLWSLLAGGALHTFHGSGPGVQLGFSVGSAGDVDGDGRPDPMAGGDEDGTAGAKAGIARVWSGATFAVLHTVLGDAAQDRMGRSVAGVGDVNGDGRSDFAVGALRDDDGGLDAGSVRVYSGLDGALLARFDGAAGDELGGALAAAGDVDEDGVPDLLAAAVLHDGAGTDRGRAWLLSPVTRPLAADRHELSLAAGGTAAFAIDAGAAHAGSLYWVLGSVSGTSPGTPDVGGMFLPLNLDLYTQITVLQPLGPNFSQFIGFLDGSGRASAGFVVAPGTDAEFTGVVLHHAYIVMEELGITDLASNPVPVTLVP